jgi:hypothetical protein
MSNYVEEEEEKTITIFLFLVWISYPSQPLSQLSALAPTLLWLADRVPRRPSFAVTTPGSTVSKSQYKFFKIK